MNPGKGAAPSHDKSLLLLNEISQQISLSQRDLSRRLNIALGLVNSYMKNMVARGLYKIRGIPPKRYAYYLTPRGFAEKTRLTLQVLRNCADLYRQAREDFVRLFAKAATEGRRRIVFVRADELAEIAFVAIHGTGAEPAAVADDEKAGSAFLGRRVIPLSGLRDEALQAVVVTSLGGRDGILAGAEGEGGV